LKFFRFLFDDAAAAKLVDQKLFEGGFEFFDDFVSERMSRPGDWGFSDVGPSD
jgi:hypothetical protein